MLVDDNEVDLLADLHSKTDLGEGRVPVGEKKTTISKSTRIFVFI